MHKLQQYLSWPHTCWFPNEWENYNSPRYCSPIRLILPYTAWGKLTVHSKHHSQCTMSLLRPKLRSIHWAFSTQTPLTRFKDHSPGCWARKVIKFNLIGKFGSKVEINRIPNDRLSNGKTLQIVCRCKFSFSFLKAGFLMVTTMDTIPMQCVRAWTSCLF